MSIEELLQLQIALNHILENRVDSDDFVILDKYGFIKYNLINGVKFILYPSNEDAKKILKDIKNSLER